ncbi:hypothetical protein E2C01_066713 [Portunus trituberculatus]|uniref:Uncharacterized protein n=1 Tax=Portunus trituberculatus TaxID=210409 RepID=A0A5B7HUK6_PORTR|nr:hypothetical protein [Portunus trituberculatus]
MKVIHDEDYGNGSEQQRGRRSGSSGDTGVVDSNVLRKVASLTLDRATIEKRVTKPKFVPEKLDFKIYEKFEGKGIGVKDSSNKKRKGLRAEFFLF